MKTHSIFGDRLSPRIRRSNAFHRPFWGRYSSLAVFTVAMIAAAGLASSMLHSAHSNRGVETDESITPIPVVFVDPPRTTAIEGQNSSASLRQYFEKDPTNAKYHVDLGKALKEEGKIDEAMREYREAIRLDDKNIEARVGLGSLFAKLYQFDDATTEFRRAVKLDPKDAKARLFLAYVLHFQGKLDESIGEYRNHLKLNRGETDDDQVLEISARFYLGKALIQKGAIVSAFKEYQRFFNKYYDYAAEDFSSMFYYCGQYLIQHEKYDDALAMNREAVRLDPGFAEARLSLGYLLVKRRAYKEAAEQLIESIRLRPDIEHAHNLLGLCLENQGELDQAVKEYREELKHEIAYKETLFNITRVFNEQRRNTEIIEVSEQWLKRYPGDSTAHYLLGRALFIEGYWDQAWMELQESILIDPKLDYAYYYLGLIESSKGRYADALKFYEKADDLGSKRANWDCPTKICIDVAKRMLAAESHLKEYVSERYHPNNEDEYFSMMAVASVKGYYRSKITLYEEYMDQRPDGELNARAMFRDWVPFEAALAGCGFGVDVHRDDQADLKRLRSKALEWMSADLAEMTREFEKNPETAEIIGHNLECWFIDFRLSAIRSLGNEVIPQEIARQASIPITGGESPQIAQTSFHPNEPKRAKPSFLKDYDQIQDSLKNHFTTDQNPRVRNQTNEIAPIISESRIVAPAEINGNPIQLHPLASIRISDDERAEWKRFWKEASDLMRKVGGRTSIKPILPIKIYQK